MIASRHPAQRIPVCRHTSRHSSMYTGVRHTTYSIPGDRQTVYWQTGAQHSSNHYPGVPAYHLLQQQTVHCHTGAWPTSRPYSGLHAAFQQNVHWHTVHNLSSYSIPIFWLIFHICLVFYCMYNTYFFLCLLFAPSFSAPTHSVADLGGQIRLQEGNQAQSRETDRQAQGRHPRFRRRESGREAGNGFCFRPCRGEQAAFTFSHFVFVFSFSFPFLLVLVFVSVFSHLCREEIKRFMTNIAFSRPPPPFLLLNPIPVPLPSRFPFRLPFPFLLPCSLSFPFPPLPIDTSISINT